MTTRRLPGASGVAPIELIGLGTLVLVAAVLRFVDLPTRGTWDADQGHDMLVLRDLVLNGQIPLLGPPTSIGDFHHGVLYYLLLAPVAAVSGADPVAVTGAIALAGTLAVAVTWWLARSIGGPIAGLLAGLLLAVSSSAVEESTFIWNPNLIALSSSIALAAAWRAWTGGRAGWWVVAGAAAVVTMHCHVLGVVLSPVIAGLLIADIRRRSRSAGGAEPVVRAGLAWLAIAAISYIPLAIHELTSGGSEIRAALAFLAEGAPVEVSLPVRIPIVGLRVLAWPLTGLITAAPIAALLAATLVVSLTFWRVASSSGDERVAVRWLGLGLAWTVVALALGASGLATVVLGLPNDHYHAFADPIVVVLVAVGLAPLARVDVPTTGRLPVGAAGAIVVVLAVVGWNLFHQPAAVTPDGGWPAAIEAGNRILRSLPAGPTEIASLPTAKGPDAVRFPLVRAGASSPVLVAPTTPPGPDAVARIVLCDDLFQVVIGAPCGGPAEDPAATTVGLRLVDRFEAAPGRWVSVYLKG
ncbi:MAG TPA: glycosyltransferase family 39 protein [Candidatus Limnocylindrales bacterium]|nr:glycosyltransferase family 39 protein [Candidatus Limnocylindrales bacterium]